MVTLYKYHPLCYVVMTAVSVFNMMVYTSIGSEAVYNTSDDYCITTNVMRTCTANRTWDGQTPSVSEGTLDQGIYGPKILVFKNKTVVFLQLLMRRCLSHSLH